VTWKPLDPYAGPAEEELPTGTELEELVAYYKRTADQHGEPHDPEWDRWLAEDRGQGQQRVVGGLGLAEAARRFGVL
jgi:hypothetical protein